jgi:putative metalloprotease
MTIDSNGLSRRQMMALIGLAGGISVSTPLRAQFNLGKAMDSAKGVAQSESLSDAELKAYFDQMAIDMDKKNPVATPKDKYGKRAAALSAGLQQYDGLKLDIKAYLVTDVNAFAMANGTIRIFAGLMDKFTDDEIRYVIGHEIGHVKLGHTKKRMQTAMRTEALMNAGSAVGGTAAKLTQGKLGELFNNVISAQHSQKHENEADAYAMGFMKARKHPPMACVTALDKLAELGSGGGLPWLSTHPSPKERSKRMRAMV